MGQMGSEPGSAGCGAGLAEAAELEPSVDEASALGLVGLAVGLGALDLRQDALAQAQVLGRDLDQLVVVDVLEASSSDI
jgi:small-conductance mechanosensitive channel